MTQHRLAVADVFREHGHAFLEQYGDTLSPERRRALRDIAACRTAALGGHVEACDQCGHQRIAYILGPVRSGTNWRQLGTGINC